MEKNQSVTKGIFTAEVVANTVVRDCFRRISLVLDADGSSAFAEAMPGQFAELDMCGAALPVGSAIPKELADCASRQIILRRPFSFADITVKGGSQIELTILYHVLGPATVRMTTLQAGDRLSVIGPLGNGFSLPRSKKTALLVAGGMGSPPLEHLSRFLRDTQPNLDVQFFAGARTLENFPFRANTNAGVSVSEFSHLQGKIHLATDDGSAGFTGFVTDHVAKWLKDNAPVTDDTIIYACGPEPMLAGIAKLAGDKKIDCEVSMERMMACGIGLCQSCAVKATSAGDSVYKLCCKDGPVFDSEDVVFE